MAAIVLVGTAAWLASVAAWLLRRRRVTTRGGASATGRLLLLAAITCTVIPSSSLALALTTDDEALLTNGANWARNSGFGWLVDTLEHWRYREPPSVEPADELPLVTVGTTAPTAATTSTTAAVSATTTLPPPPFAPAPLQPVLDDPLEGEGVWTPIPVPGEADLMWVTAMRPIAARGSVTATYVYIRPDRLRAQLYAGAELPGGDDWEYGRRVRQPQLPWLVAAFNGGFRFEHIAGGYMSEGRTVEPLAAGEATLGIDRDGRITIGEYGRDLVDDGSWASLRQTLPLLVDKGVDMTTGTWAGAWGVDTGNVIYVLRSAVCTTVDGDLVYVIAGDVDASMLATILIGAGCHMAMQLDINGDWPQFARFDGLGTADRTPHLVDRRMSNTWRYLNGSKKDFFALFLRD